MHHPSALPPLLTALNAVDPDRRIDALRALAEHGGPQTMGILRQIAGADEDRRVADAALHVLGRLATSDAIAVLIELTAEAACRETCIDVLARVGEDRAAVVAAGLHHSRPEVRRAVVGALERMKRCRSTEMLCDALEDPDPAVRLDTVTALAHLSNHQAGRKLALLAHADPSPAVRSAAQASLRR